jgi:hypothetical protein
MRVPPLKRDAEAGFHAANLDEAARHVSRLDVVETLRVRAAVSSLPIRATALFPSGREDPERNTDRPPIRDVPAQLSARLHDFGEGKAA